jgi:hypothetical protein
MRLFNPHPEDALSRHDLDPAPMLEPMEPRLLMSATPVSKLRILDAAGAEGSAANPGRIVFTVKRLGSTVGRAVARFRTISLQGANAATLGADLQFAAGRIVFKNGQKTQQIVVNLIGNNIPEATKRFGVQLLKPKNVKFAKSIGVGSILDDDGAVPSIAINDIAVLEGQSGTKTVFFTVTLSRVHNQVVTVKFATKDGSASSGAHPFQPGPEDFIATSGTLTFQPGETVKSIPVQIVGDTFEAKQLFEVFSVVLSDATNATIAKGTGMGTIEDNDGKWAK